MVREVQCFLRFTNFHMIFVMNYSKIFVALTCLTCKDNLDLGLEIGKAFQSLKATFIITSILIHPSFNKPFFVLVDASNFPLDHTDFFNHFMSSNNCSHPYPWISSQTLEENGSFLTTPGRKCTIPSVQSQEDFHSQVYKF